LNSAIATASAPAPKPRGRTSDADLTAFVLSVGDELEGRLFISKVEPRATELFLTVQDGHSSTRRRISVSKDLSLGDIRRRILKEATEIVLETDQKRKRA
jgi:hypothetical protein